MRVVSDQQSREALPKPVSSCRLVVIEGGSRGLLTFEGASRAE